MFSPSRGSRRIEELELNGVSFDIEYEGLAQICFKCGCYGHLIEECGIGKDREEAMEGVTGLLTMNGAQSEPFGPWMIASNGRRQRQIGSNGEVIKGEAVTTMTVRDTPKTSAAQEGSRFRL